MSQKIVCKYCERNNLEQEECKFCGENLSDEEIQEEKAEEYFKDGGPFPDTQPYSEYIEFEDPHSSSRFPILLIDEEQNISTSPPFFKFLGIILFAIIIAFGWWYSINDSKISPMDYPIQVHSISYETPEQAKNEQLLPNAEGVVRQYLNLLKTGKLDEAYAMLYAPLQEHPSFHRPAWDEYIRENQFSIHENGVQDVNQYKKYFYSVTFYGNPFPYTWTYCLWTNGTDWLIIEIHDEFMRCW